MNKYRYVAVDLKKKKFTGIMLAQTEDQLRSLLLADNLYLVSYTILSDKPPSNFFSVSGKVKTKELTAFCNQFSIMINAGIPIVDCVGMLKQQKYTPYFVKVLDRVYQDVKQGIYLSDSLKKYPTVFPDFFQSMVYVGEKSGGLDKVLISLGDYYETEEKIKKKVSGA
ncbi:MAG: type II secretion system F family protein, partial [Clostridia bacterium]|nr:type II secretion system F family protein [Clostridia bacterium]